MIMKLLAAMLLLLIAITSCSQKESVKVNSGITSEDIQVTKTRPSHVRTGPIYDSTLDNSRSLKSLWNELVFEKGGCLTGGQYADDGTFGSDACVMSDYKKTGGADNKWKLFFEAYSKKELTEFLLTQIPDTTATKIHTCPCMGAKNGEVAVYALHRLYGKSWYQLKGFEEYEKREGMGCFDNPQSWLWEILEDKARAQKLVEAWQQVAS